VFATNLFGHYVLVRFDAVDLSMLWWTHRAILSLTSKNWMKCLDTW
jgi:hypothetical protein